MTALAWPACMNLLLWHVTRSHSDQPQTGRSPRSRAGVKLGTCLLYKAQRSTGFPEVRLDSWWEQQLLLGKPNCHYREASGLREKLTHGGGSACSKGHPSPFSPPNSSCTVILPRKPLGPLVFIPSPSPPPQGLSRKQGQAASPRSFSSAPPTATTAKANASGLCRNSYPNLLQSLKASSTFTLPPSTPGTHHTGSYPSTALYPAPASGS